VRDCLRRNQPGPYQVQAAINAVHSDATTAGETDWLQVLALYDQLLAISPTPIVMLNRAVAVAEVHGPALALATIEDLELDEYHLYHATRGELLARLGRAREARDAYDRAYEFATNTTERDLIESKRNSL